MGRLATGHEGVWGERAFGGKRAGRDTGRGSHECAELAGPGAARPCHRLPSEGDRGPRGRAVVEPRCGAAGAGPARGGRDPERRGGDRACDGSAGARRGAVPVLLWGWPGLLVPGFPPLFQP